MTGKHWMRRAVLAAAGGLAGSAQAQVPAVPAQGPIERVWSWGFPEVLALTLSPEGERVLVLCRDGTLQCHKSTGERLWRRKQPDVDWMSTSLGAELTVLWAARRPEHAVVHFVDRTGHYYQYLDISAPVRTAVVSPGGEYIAVAAGRTVLFCIRGQTSMRVRPLDVGATPRRLQFGPGDSLYVACEDPPSVLLIRSSGRVLWRRESPQVSAYSLSASQDGQRVAVGSWGPGDLVTAALMDEAGMTRWSVQQPGRNPHVRLSGDGENILLSYEHRLAHASEEHFVRRLAFWPGGAQGHWIKGGVYTAPLPLSLERTGRWVVALDQPRREQLARIRMYGRDGKARYAYTCPAPVVVAAASREGRHLATVLSDGHLEVLRISEA